MINSEWLSREIKDVYKEKFKKVYFLTFEEDKLGFSETIRAIEEFDSWLRGHLSSLEVIPIEGWRSLRSIEEIKQTNLNFRNKCYSLGRFLP